MRGNKQIEDATALVASMYAAAVDASDPEAAVGRHLKRDGDALVVNNRRWTVRGRLVVVGAGKAALPMSLAVERICGSLVTSGLEITKDGHAGDADLATIEIVEAAHPIPDRRGVAATERMLASLDGLGADDIVLALISGGGSALLEAPKEGVTLEDLARVTDLLLRAGAPIQDLNTVRRPLSRVKGGGLLSAAGEAPVISLILSDVLGNDPQVIASGPTVPSPSTGQDPLSVLERYRLLDQVPTSVRDALNALPGFDEATVKHRDGAFAIVADNSTAIAAAVVAAERAGQRVEVLWRDREGEAAELGVEWVRCAQGADEDIDVLIGGGEATVTVKGGGVGGRNTEFALAAAMELAATGDASWLIASLATDGQDGPTGVAGAVADASTASRARSAGIDPDAALHDNDSMRVFESAGGLVSPGPTGTNVNDLYFAVRLGVAE